MLNIYEKAIPGKSLAGFEIGQSLVELSQFADKIIDGNEIPWSESIRLENTGVVLYNCWEFGASIYFSEPNLILHFDKIDGLVKIIAGNGFKGEVYKGVKIGDPISKIDHALYLDSGEDMHFLCNQYEDILPGVYFHADGDPVSEYPDQIIQKVCVYDRNLWK